MWNMLWPIILVVASNTIYNICAKSTPETVDSFASLTVTYLVAAVCSAVMFFLTSAEKSVSLQLGRMNWTTPVLGIAIIGLEFGYLCAYRVGWKISSTQITCSLLLAAVLVVVGFFLYHENITLRQGIGLAVCGAGLILLSGK